MPYRSELARDWQSIPDNAKRLPVQQLSGFDTMQESRNLPAEVSEVASRLLSGTQRRGGCKFQLQCPILGNPDPASDQFSSVGGH